MKHAWMATHGELSMEETEEGKAITGILVNCITGEKRVGDYIDEAMVLAQDGLRKYGYFREDIHMVSLTFWDMRYAGPKVLAGLKVLPIPTTEKQKDEVLKLFPMAKFDSATTKSIELLPREVKDKIFDLVIMKKGLDVIDEFIGTCSKK